MSGSLSALQNNFISTYSPYASQAGSALGVDPNVILSQWALESGWGTNSGSSGFNVAGIGGSNEAVYNSPSAFTNAYTNLIQNAYSGATNVGSDIGSFVGGLANGSNGSYFGNADPSTYGSSLGNVYNEITGQTTTAPPSNNTYTQTGQTTTAPPSGNSPGWLQSLLGFNNYYAPGGPKTLNLPGGSIALRIGLAILALILIGIGIAALALKTEPGQIVKQAAETVTG